MSSGKNNTSTAGPIPQRWSSRAKQEVVLRLLAGESLDVVSRETEVPVHKLERWRERALLGIGEALKEHGEGEASSRELEEAQATIGRLTMELELYRGKGQRRMR